MAREGTIRRDEIDAKARASDMLSSCLDVYYSRPPFSFRRTPFQSSLPTADLTHAMPQHPNSPIGQMPPHAHVFARVVFVWCDDGILAFTFLAFTRWKDAVGLGLSGVLCVARIGAHCLFSCPRNNKVEFTKFCLILELGAGSPSICLSSGIETRRVGPSGIDNAQESSSGALGRLLRLSLRTSGLSQGLGTGFPLWFFALLTAAWGFQ